MVCPSGEKVGDAESWPCISTVSGPSVPVDGSNVATTSCVDCSSPCLHTIAMLFPSGDSAGCAQSSSGLVSGVPAAPGLAVSHTCECTADCVSIEYLV